MSKAVSKGAHWMPRMAQFSTHGQRNGRVDVLPPNAKMPTFLELRDRYSRMKLDFQEASAEYKVAADRLYKDPDYKRHVQHFHANRGKAFIAMPSRFAKQLDDLAPLHARMTGLAAKLQSFKVIFHEEKNARYERVWIDTAKAMLPWDVVDKIESVVNDNLEQSLNTGAVHE